MSDSRSPSHAPGDSGPQPKQEHSRSPSRNRRGRSQSSRPVSRSWSQAPSEASVDQADSPPSRPQSRNARRRKNRKAKQGGGLPSLDETEDPTRQVANTGGGAVQGGQEEKAEKKDKKDEPLRLRLDLNIDIELELKARVHGDLTLALLWVPSVFLGA